MSTASGNLAVRLLGYASDTPGAAAIVQGDLTLNYASFADRVRSTGRLLRQLGVAPENRVALLFGNDHRFLEALLAVLYVGAVAVPLNTRSGVSALRHVVADCATSLIVAHDTLAQLAGALASPVRARVLVTCGHDGWDVSHARPLTRQDTGRSDAPHAVSGDTIALQPYTSGSTGLPKGCLLTHGGQYWNAVTTRDVWHLNDTDRGLVTAPLYHKNAMICVVKPMLLAGGTIVIGSSADPAGIPAEVARHHCTYTTGVPATYQMLLDSGEHNRQDLSSLRFVICGSAPLPEAFGRRVSAALGVPVIEAYGLTEGGPQVLMSPREGEPRFGKAGQAMPGGEVRLLDIRDMPADGVEGVPQVPVGSVGEMWVRNPGVTAGYFALPDVTAARISSDGWLRTGDLATVDTDGFYTVFGRADDMINVGGENVYPIEVERLLLAMPQIRQVVVVAVPHPTKGQVPVAFVQADGLTQEQVKAHALTEGAAHAHPRHVWFIDDFPLGGTGKIDRAALTEQATTRLAAMEGT